MGGKLATALPAVTCGEEFVRLCEDHHPSLLWFHVQRFSFRVCDTSRPVGIRL